MISRLLNFHRFPCGANLTMRGCAKDLVDWWRGDHGLGSCWWCNQLLWNCSTTL